MFKWFELSSRWVPLLNISQSYFQAVFYLDLGFLSLFYTRAKKVMHVSCFVDTVNFTIFQNVIA